MDSHAQYWRAAVCDIAIAGNPSRPMLNVMSVYGGVGLLVPSGFLLCGKSASYQRSYSFQRTSHLPIQNGATFTSTCGPSCSARPFSPSGAPIKNAPPWIATMSNVTSLPGIVAV